MAKEKNGILEGRELLWDVALRGIGIQLPDEYVLRFCALLEKYGEVGLDDISLNDFADIELSARKEMQRRLPEQPADEKPEPKSEHNEDGRLIVNYCPGYTPTQGLNTLDYFGITTIGQLTKISKKSIRRLPHIGQKTLRALDETLKSLGLLFGRHYIKAYYKKQPNDENTMPFYRFSHIELTANPEEASYYITNDIIWDDDKSKHQDLYFID